MQLSAFDQLQVSTTASDQEIKSAYLAQVRCYPPDQQPEKFQALREAYERIATEDSRLMYTLFEEPTLGLHDFLSILVRKNESHTQAIDSTLLRSLIKEGLNAQ